MTNIDKIWQKIQKLPPDSGTEFERIMTVSVKKCFRDNFSVYGTSKNSKVPGIKCLPSAKGGFISPDIIIANKAYKGKLQDIPLSEIRMVIELKTNSHKGIIPEAWKDAFKYEACRSSLLKNKIAVGFVALFGVTPDLCREHGNIEVENWNKNGTPDYLELNRWTFAGFLQPYDKENKPAPEWCWVSNTPLTKSFEISVEAGSILIPLAKKFTLSVDYLTATNASDTQCVAIAPILSETVQQESLDLIPATSYIVNPLQLLFESISEILNKRNNLILLPVKTPAGDYSPHSDATNRATTICRPVIVKTKLNTHEII